MHEASRSTHKCRCRPSKKLPSAPTAIRRNHQQRQSDAIRGNQRQSEAIERTRALPSDAIRGHSGPIRRNRRSLRGHPEASPRPLPTKRHVRCCWLGNPIAIGCNQVQSGAITHEAARALLLAWQSDCNLRRVERIRLERLGRRDHVRRGQPLEMVHASGGRGALHRPDEGWMREVISLMMGAISLMRGGRSIALMREAIRDHQRSSKPASHSTACVRLHTGLCRRRPEVKDG